LLLILLVAVPSAAAARKTQHPQPPLTLRPAFHLVSSQATNVLATARYVFFATTKYTATPEGTQVSDFGTLIDEHTGHQSRLSPPGCPEFFAEVGGPWLLFTCGNSGTEELYNLTTRAWKTVHTRCTSSDTGQCGPVGIGADWIRFEDSCYHCSDGFWDQNIRTGRVRTDPEVAGGTKIANLDSPALAAGLCRPLRVPTSAAPTPDGKIEPGFLTLFGQFALASVIPSETGGWGASSYFYLERCGTHMRKALPGDPTSPPAADRDAVIWENRARIEGLVLPSLRPLRIIVPADVQQPPVALSGSTLYLGYGNGSGNQGPLWAARLRLHP
jgi:hypothetical protein